MEQLKAKFDQMASGELLHQRVVVLGARAFDLEAVARGLNCVGVEHVEVSVE